MSGTENLADLVITFAAIDAPALAAFTEVSTAGEEMVAAVTSATAEVAAATEEMVASTQSAAARVAEANTRMAEVEKEWAASAEQATAQVVAANEEQAASFAALKAKVEGDVAAMAVAENEAAASNELMSAKMAGSAAGMGTMSVAAGRAKSAYSDAAGSIGMTSGQLTILAAAAAAVAIGTTKMAGDFQSETQTLVSSAGEVQANLGKVRDGILNISSATGYSAKELAAGMYKVESGGQHGAAGLKVLQAAAEGARAENADLTTVSDALTSAMTDYHMKAGDAARVTSQLVAATGAGKMTFQELAGSLASVLPVASANHVALSDILGDMASMTVHGMSAQRASQNLADAIRHMAGPTQQQQKEFALLGTNTQAVSASLGTKGLSGTINDLATRIQQRMGPGATQVILHLGDALKGLDPKVRALGAQLMSGQITMGGYTKAMKDLPPILAGQAGQFATLAKSTHAIGNEQMSGAQVMQTYSGAMRAAMGDATGMNVALMLTGKNAGTTQDAINAVAGASEEAGGHVKGWAGIQGTFNQKVKEAHASFSALAIQIGQVLLPVLTKLLGWIAAGAKWFADHKAAATALAIVIGGILVVAFVALTVAAWGFAAAMLANPAVWIILAIIVAVAALIAIVVLIVKNWGPIKEFFVKLWQHIVDAFKAAGHWIAKEWNTLGLWIDKVQIWFKALPGKIWNSLVGLGKAIGNWIAGIGSAIGRFFSNAANWLLNAGWNIIMGFLNGLKQAWNNVTGFVSGIGPWIADHKGPIEVDRVLLTPHGKAIMSGLHAGMVSQNRVVQAFVQSVPGQIRASLQGASASAVKAGHSYAERLAAGIKGSQHLAVNAARDLAATIGQVHAGPGGLAVGARTAGYAYAGSLAARAANGGDTHLHVTVQGSVWTTRDLAAELQTEFTRIGMRNTSNGTSYMARSSAMAR